MILHGLAHLFDGLPVRFRPLFLLCIFCVTGCVIILGSNGLNQETEQVAPFIIYYSYSAKKKWHRLDGTLVSLKIISAIQ